MNKVVLIGRLTKDPETRTTKVGVPCTTFTIAVNRRFGGKDGNKECDFLNIVTWRKTAELCTRFLTKGSKVCVDGSIQSHSYEVQDGSKRTVTEIIADSVEFLSDGKVNKTPDGYTETDEELPF